jgi:hypothetical protein
MLKSGDNDLLNLIYTQMGTLFLYQDLYEEGLNMFQKAYQLDVQAKDTAYMIYDLRDIANAFHHLLLRHKSIKRYNYDKINFSNRELTLLFELRGSRKTSYYSYRNL